MTGPDAGGATEAAAAAAADALDDAEGVLADAPTPTPVRPSSPFSLEGRSVPALYLIAWILVLIGAGSLFVSFMATVSAAAPWLFLFGALFLGFGVVAGAGSQAVERSKQPDLPFRGPSPALVLVAVVALTISFVVVVLGPLSALGLDAASPFATMLNLAITAALYIGLVRMLVVGTGALTWAEMGVTRLGGAAVRELSLGALLAVPVLVVTLALGLVLSQFLVPAPPVLPAAADLGGLLVNLVSAAVLAPVGEEIFFRGFATTAWFRAGGAGAAVVRGAILFALAHVLTLFDASFGEGAQRALYAFLMLMPPAIALGWVFLKRRSIWAAIGLHAAFNAIQVLMLFLAVGPR